MRLLRCKMAVNSALLSNFERLRHTLALFLGMPFLRHTNQVKFSPPWLRGIATAPIKRYSIRHRDAASLRTCADRSIDVAHRDNLRHGKDCDAQDKNSGPCREIRLGLRREQDGAHGSRGNTGEQALDTWPDRCASRQIRQQARGEDAEDPPHP